MTHKSTQNPQLRSGALIFPRVLLPRVILLLLAIVPVQLDAPGPEKCPSGHSMQSPGPSNDLYVPAEHSKRNIEKCAVIEVRKDPL